MTFQYALTLPAEGPNKLARFKDWAKTNVPEIAFNLPPQVPVEATALTVRLKSDEERARIREVFPKTLP